MWSKRDQEKEQAKEGFCPCFSKSKQQSLETLLSTCVPLNNSSYTLSSHLCPLVKEGNRLWLFVSNFPIQMRKGGRSETLPCDSDHVSAGLFLPRLLPSAQGFEQSPDSQGCINSGAACGSGTALDFHVENGENTLQLYSRINRKQIHTFNEISSMLVFQSPRDKTPTYQSLLCQSIPCMSFTLSNVFFIA